MSYRPPPPPLSRHYSAEVWAGTRRPVGRDSVPDRTRTLESPRPSERARGPVVGRIWLLCLRPTPEGRPGGRPEARVRRQGPDGSEPEGHVRDPPPEPPGKDRSPLGVGRGRRQGPCASRTSARPVLRLRFARPAFSSGRPSGPCAGRAEWNFSNGDSRCGACLPSWGHRRYRGESDGPARPDPSRPRSRDPPRRPTRSRPGRGNWAGAGGVRRPFTSEIRRIPESKGQTSF